MILDMSGKVVLVTGAANGIGAEIARTFIREGADVVALDAAAVDLGDGPEPAVRHVLDVRRRVDVRRVVGSVVETFGRIDVLVNNAGVAGDGLPLSETDDTAWDRCFDVNVKGLMHMCQAVVPVMKKQRAGRIINAGSFAASVPLVGGGAYAASKAAAAQVSRTLAGELGPWGITVNSYAPGMVPTALGKFGDMPSGDQDRLLDTLALRRWGTPGEVADVVMFLASELARYMTGATVDVTGGKLLTQIPAMAYERGDVAESS